ncbi:MAG: amidase [Woeseia sp.]
MNFRSGIIVAGAALLVACAQESSSPETPVAPTSFDVAEATITDLQRAMQDGEISARGLAEIYLARIDAVDRDGPRLNSIVEINPDALAIADELDRERAAGKLRSPLHGIPVVLKANIDTGDSMATHAGSLALQDHHAQDDAFLVGQLRAAGAVILAKANLSEWANFRSKDSSSGWSSVGGQTRNAYDPARNPCGSSSGSAVAVSANLSVLAVGTETDGSIICPSSINGIVGIKPTLGLVSRDGIIPIAHSQDTAGPMARTVQDAALLLNALVARDDSDPASGGRPDELPDYAANLRKDALAGKRIGVLRSYGGAGRNDQVEAIFEKSIAVLRENGATIIDPVNIDTEGMGDAEYGVLLYEFKTDLNAYLATADAAVGSLADVIAFNASNAETVMPFFGQDILIAAQEKGPLTDAAYLQALEKSKRIARNGIDNALREQKLDALLAPSNGPAWLTDHVLGDHFSVGSSSFAAISGYANVTVPAGQVHGLPIGLSFIGGAFSERKLIELAYAFEQISLARQVPTPENPQRP